MQREILRRTKIVATLGPATDDRQVIDAMVAAGLDVARLNFSHGETDDHINRAKMIRESAAQQGRVVGILVDLQGPKLRIAEFKNNKVMLEEGAIFILDSVLASDAGDETRVGLDYKGLPGDVENGDFLLLDDGGIVLWVDGTSETEVICKVVVGGPLSNNKGINKQGGGLSAPALTEKDILDIKTAAAIEADYVAVSFPRSANDIHHARDLLHDAGGHGGIVAKIERTEALENLDDIIEASEVVMVARGDLGVEIGDAELPGVQKMIIEKARKLNCMVITATQMMQSMVTQQIPTRAEVFDVANAVLDGTDAVMLSEETAAGKFPVKVVEAMDRICHGASKQVAASKIRQRMDDHEFHFVDQSIAMATMYTANRLGVRAIITLTESGSTAQWMSRISSGIPIYAMTRHERTRRRVTMMRGVYPIAHDVESKNHIAINDEVIKELVEDGTVRKGDIVIITKGDLMGIHGNTNTMKIVSVGEDLPVE